jgi:hypothetical protein
MNTFDMKKWQDFMDKLAAELAASREEETDRRFKRRWLHIPDNKTREETEREWDEYWEGRKS